MLAGVSHRLAAAGTGAGALAEVHFSRRVQDAVTFCRKSSLLCKGVFFVAAASSGTVLRDV